MYKSTLPRDVWMVLNNTNNPRALGQGSVGVLRLYHFSVVPTQGAIPEKEEY